MDERLNEVIERAQGYLRQRISLYKRWEEATEARQNNPFSRPANEALWELEEELAQLDKQAVFVLVDVLAAIEQKN